MDRDDSVDVITTINGGAAPSRAVQQSGALLGYESGNDRPPQDYPVAFVDWPFSKEGVTFADHLDAVRRESPKIAVAPDVEDADELDRAIEQADELAEYADVVVMVPKAVHPTEIPDRFRVGLPLANFGKATEDVDEFVDVGGTPEFHQWTDYRDVESVHILGGSPTIQLEVPKYGVPVDSVDGASVFKGAQMGNIWAPTAERNWHPTHPDHFGFYDRLRASLNNIVEAWNGSGDYTVPEDRDDVQEARSSDRYQTAEQRQHHMAGAHGAPPAIAEDERDLWDEGELEEMDPVVLEWSEELEDAEDAALEAMTPPGEQGTLGAVQEDSEDVVDEQPDPAVAADGGTEQAPRMYWVKGPQGPQDWLDGQDVLVSAGVAWMNPGDGFSTDVPDAENLFVDSGGYQAAVHFQDEYPYGPRELFEWAEEIGADYVAGMDWACEDAEQLAKLYDDVDPDDIAPADERLERTIVDQAEQLEVYEAGNWSFELVPVVQGLSTDQYRYCARRLRQENLAASYMGIGTVCKRESADGILEVLDACEEELPATEWHLFGATKEVWSDRRFWGRFRSADTHAWAMKTPEGEWTQNDQDKIRAFEAYHDDIEQYREEMAEQSTFSTDHASRALASSLVAIGAKRCVCGTCIPAYAVDFEPGCRHCERTAINRFDAAMADVEEATKSMSDDDSNPYDPSNEFDTGQRTLGAGRTDPQTTIADVEDSDGAEIESVDEFNEGGLEADEREDVGADVETVQDSFGEDDPTDEIDDEQSGLGDVYDPTEEDDGPGIDGYDDAQEELREKNPELTIYVHEKDDHLTLEKIIVPEDQRGEGKGTAFMEDLADYADRTGKSVSLTPSEDYGASSRERLIDFYSRFGFVKNEGENRDYQISEGMYRLPADGDDWSPDAYEGTMDPTIDPRPEEEQGRHPEELDRGALSEEDFEIIDGAGAESQRADGYHYADREKPEAREKHTEIMSGIYDPTDEGEEQSDDHRDFDEFVDELAAIDGVQREAARNLANEFFDLDDIVSKNDEYIVDRVHGVGPATVEAIREAAAEKGQGVPQEAIQDATERITELSESDHDDEYMVVLEEWAEEYDPDQAAFEDAADDLAFLVFGEGNNTAVGRAVQMAQDRAESNDGQFKNERMENAYYWGAQTAGWLRDGPNGGFEGDYYVDLKAGQPIIVLDADAFSHDSRVDAIVDGLREYDFPPEITTREIDRSDEIRVFIQPDDSRLSSNYVDDWRDWSPHDGFTDTAIDTTDQDDGVSENVDDVDALYAVVHEDGAHKHIEGFDDEAKAQQRADELGDEYVAQADDGTEEDESDQEDDVEIPADADDGPTYEDEPLEYTIEASKKDWRTAQDALGLLRRGWKDHRHDAEGYDRDDIGHVLSVINEASSTGDVDMSETELEIMWHATSVYADEADNNAAINSLEESLADAEIAADRPEAHFPETLAEAVDTTAEADGWAPHEWSRPDDSLHHAEYHRRGSSEKVVVNTVADSYNVQIVDAEDDVAQTLESKTGEPVDAIVEGLNDYYGEDDDPEPEPTADPIEIEFGKRQYANDYRDGNEEHLHGNDNKSMKTVRLEPSAPDDVVEKAEDKALQSRADETKKYGQTPLTDEEREQLEERDDWQWGTNGFQAEGVKAALLAEGATDWMNYYEAGMGQDSALELFDQGKQRAAQEGAPTAAGDVDDSDPDVGDLATQAEKVEAEQCGSARDAAEEEGDLEAIDFLLQHCDWTEDEVAELEDTFAAIGEEPDTILGAVYNPTEDTGEDIGASFDEWAAEAAPEPPTEPSDEELRQIAPDTDERPPDEELPAEAYRALKKAWSGYKLSREEQRDAVARADHFASVINGIRAVNGQDPIEFEGVEGFEGGRPLPNDGDEEFPTHDGQKSLDEAKEEGRLSGAVQSGLNRFVGECYDPCGEFDE